MSEPIFASGYVRPPTPSEPPAPVVETPPATPGSPAPTDGTPAPVGSVPAESTVPASPPVPAPTTEEGALTDPSQPRQRPFVARLIRENERHKADMERLQAQNDLLLRQLQGAQPQGQPQPQPIAQPQSTPDQPPQPEQYATHQAWVLAASQWSARQEYQRAEQERLAKDAAAQQQQQQQTAAQQWAQQQQAGRQKYADFDEAVSEALFAPQVQGVVTQLFRTHPQGPDLVYYLGQHPQDLQALNQLPMFEAALWCGALAERLKPPSVSGLAPTPPPLPIGTPPPPMAAVAANGTTPVAMGARPGMSIREYRSIRTAQQGR